MSVALKVEELLVAAEIAFQNLDIERLFEQQDSSLPEPVRVSAVVLAVIEKVERAEEQREATDPLSVKHPWQTLRQFEELRGGWWRLSDKLIALLINAYGLTKTEVRQHRAKFKAEVKSTSRRSKNWEPRLPAPSTPE